MPDDPVQQLLPVTRKTSPHADCSPTLPCLVDNACPAARFVWEEFLHGVICNPHTATVTDLISPLLLDRMMPFGRKNAKPTLVADVVLVRRAADFNEPALSFTASYAIASVLVTLAGRLIVRIMS